MKKQHSVLLSTILISSAIFAIYKVKNNAIKIDSINVGSTVNSTDNQDKITTDVVLQKLSILGDRCRGCGKCVRIDPAHFEINPTTRKAMVISSINLDSVALIQAINNCHDNAISLM
jgi:ferredoxin